MSDRTEHLDLTPSRVLWAIIAVASLWLLGWTIVAVGFALSRCLGAGCDAPTPAWVFVATLVAGGIVMLSAGPVARRLTGFRLAWLASLGGPTLLALVVVGLRSGALAWGG